MTRESITIDIKNINNNNILVELPTGTGKSKIALEILKSKKIKNDILIVVPRNVLKDNWKEEFIKWGMEEYLDGVTFTTYVSLPKHAGKWKVIICDEVHHLSDRCREALTSFTIENSILLSATVKYTLKDELKDVFDNLYIYKITTKKAIEENILPDPKVYLLGLCLNNKIADNYLILNKGKKQYPKIMPYEAYWKCKKNKTYSFKIAMTEQQYYNIISNDIDFYKRKSHGNERMKNIWLHKCGERLKWLSVNKNSLLLELLDKVDKYRTLTFCSSIEQTELLGEYCINSKNKESLSNLDKFNKGVIKHITACSMLNEGCNLTDCQIGIYANLNSSETIVKQRLGRILRHKNPIIIIPFYKNTRDEELVNKMLEDYNPELITIINNINEIKL